MNKTKKIIISLSVSLVFLLIINYIFNFRSNNSYIKVPVFKNNLLEDSLLNRSNISYVNVKTSDLNKDFLEQVINADDMKNLKINRNVYQGEFILKSLIKEDDANSETDYEQVSLPISRDSVVTCKNLKFGDLVDVYYTAKLKDVSYAIKDKTRIYSNNEKEGYVTCVLFENAQVLSIGDSTGSEAGVVTNIVVRLKKEDAMLVSNLKALGTIDILIK